MDREEARAREEGWDFDREAHLDGWREQGWPGPPTPENARILHVGRMWWAFDNLELAQQTTGFEVAEHEVEGVILRLGMAKRHWYERAKEEMSRTRE